MPPLSPDSTVRRTRLANGVVVLTEEMPHVRTAAFAVVQLQGSRDEAAAENGLAHFLEHFLFRGTKPRPGGAGGRSEMDIAVATDLVGGEIDAFTYRERTAYTAEVMDSLLPTAADLLMDIVGHPLLPASELERERSVVREEIRSFEDAPDDVVAELSIARYWPDHPLSRPIEGTFETLESFTIDEVRGFWARKHVGGNLLACAAGRVDHDDVVGLVERGLGQLPPGTPTAGPPAPPPVRGTLVERRDHLEQAQLILSLPGMAAGDPDLPALSVLITALGGGMSSRLWQRVREHEGLAYDVSFAHAGYRDAGRLTFFAATGPENVGRVVEIFETEAATAAATALPQAEFERAVQCLRAGTVLGMESPVERLSELVHGETVFGRHLTIDDHLARLAAVTRDQVLEVAGRLLRSPVRSLVVLGPDDTPDLGEDSLGSG